MTAIGGVDELGNPRTIPVRLYAGTGAGTVVFHSAAEYRRLEHVERARAGVAVGGHHGDTGWPLEYGECDCEVYCRCDSEIEEAA